ncbi:MAG: hypothetical protein IH597_15045 [Bacteroidales bacterium]|nr:hypothetical protein [Bacteroidales bacterium]
MDKRNLINGEKPEFGNPKHIAWYKRMARILQGDEPAGEIDWMKCHYWGASTASGAPKHCWPDDEHPADALVAYIECPRCRRQHKLLVTYDPQGNWYDELISCDESVKQFECWNCGLEFYTDEDRNVYVKCHTDEL